MKKRRLRLLWLIPAVAIAILLLGAVLLHTPLARRLIFEQARARLLRSSAIDIQTAGFKYNLFTGKIELEDLTIRAAAAPDLPPLFHADRVYLEPDLSAIIRGSWDFEELQIDAPKIRIYTGPDGKDNLPKAKAPSGRSPEFLIAHAEVRDGSLLFEDLRKQLSLSFPKWHLQMKGDRHSSGHKIDFSIEQPASFQYQTRRIPIEQVRVSGLLQRDTFRADAVHFRTIHSTLSLTGNIRGFSGPEIDLQIKPELDLREISPILNLRQITEGRLAGTIHLSGTRRDLKIAARLKGTHFSALTYHNTSFDLNLNAGWNPDRLQINRAQIQSPYGSVSGSAELVPGSSPGINSVEAELHNFNLSPVWRMLRPPFDLASRATGKSSLRWTGAFNPLKISGHASLNLVATQKDPERHVLPASGKIDARLRPGNTLIILDQFSALYTDLQGQLALRSFREMDGEFGGSSKDIGTLIANLSRFLGGSDNPTGTTKLAGPIQFRAQAAGTLARPDVSITSDVPELQAGTWKHLSAHTEGRIESTQISFQSTLSMPGNATIQARGGLDISGSVPVLALDARGDGIPATGVLAMLDSKIPASGNLNARLHLGGKTDELIGSAFIEGDNLSLHGEPLGHLDIGLRLANKEIRSEQFTLIRDPLRPTTDRIEAQFAYAIDTDLFRFHAAGKDLRFTNLSLPNGPPIHGVWDLAASGSGTIEHPSIDVKLESNDLRVRQQSFGPVAIAASLKDKDLRMEATAPAIHAHSSASVFNEHPYPFRGELHIANTDLASLGFKAANGQPVTGAIEADISGSGNFSQFAHSQFAAQIKTLRLKAGNLELHTQELTQAEYRDNAIEITSARIISGNSSLLVSGRIPIRQPAPPGSLHLKGQLDLAQTAGFALLPEGYAAAGIVNMDLALSGTLQKPEGEGTIALNNGELRIAGILTPLTGINVLANVHNGSTVLQHADASWGQGVIALKGEFPLGLLPWKIPIQFPRKEGPAVFTLDMNNLRPEASGRLPNGISGLVSLHAEGSMDRMDARALNARIDFRDLSFRANEIALGQNQPSTILLRNGIASISRLSFSGADTSITASGTAGILPGSTMDLRLNGDLNAALLTFMSRDLKATGRLKVQVSATGDLKAPRLSGSAEMNGGKLTLRSPRVVADSLTMRLTLDPQQITVQEFKGTLNGGPMSLTGTAGYRDGIFNGLNLKVTLQDFFFNFPEGLKSSSSGDLTIQSAEGAIVVGGNMRIQESSFRESFEVTGQLMSYLKEQQVVLQDTKPDPLLDRIQLNIALRTETPLWLQNNMVRAAANANVRLVGSFKDPTMVGRISLEDGGEITFNRQQYYISRGTVILTNQTRIEPEFDIQAQTKIGVYNITLQITGSLERLTTTISSEPALSQADISALLLTGKTTSEVQGRQAQEVRTQALALIAGQAGEEITDEARRALGLSMLRIDPGLIASESDPGARLTIGEDITRKLTVIYSMNLTNGGDQIWSAQYEIVRRLTTQATKQQDNSYRFEFNHNLLFGSSSGTRGSRTEVKSFEIGEIRFEGAEPFSDKTLLNSLKIKPGQKYDFPKLQKGLDRLHDFYIKQNRLEANIRMSRETLEEKVNLTATIDSGPVVDFSFEGSSLPEQVREDVRKAWANGAFDMERTEDAVRTVRLPLLEAGFLQSEVAYDINDEADKRTIRFRITPGVRYANVPVVFNGSAAISSAQLNNVLDQASLRLEVYANPQRVVDYLNQLYRERGYLQANVGAPIQQLDPQTGTGRTIFQIREGPLFKIGELEFSGHSVFNYDELWSVIPTSSGSSYDPNTLQDAIKALESLYQSRGYNDVSATFRIVLDAPKERANLTFYIVERRQSLIRDIVIEGNQDTSTDFVRRQLAFAVGDQLDSAKINETRRRLYSSGVFSTVDFQTEEIPAARPDSRIKDMRVRIRVREVSPYRLQYGLFYDTERGMGGIMEIENRNFLGRALDVGLRTRYDSDLKEGRLFFYQPFVTKIHLKTDASAFVQSETRPGFSARRIGFSLFQEKNIARSFRLDYGYRYDHVRWNGIPPDPTIFQASVPVARLITTLSRDTRDSILDATRGEFSSHSLEFGPKFLGSEVGFIRYYGQYFRYVPLDKFLLKQPKEKEKKSAPKKLVLASALRLGLTTAFGDSSVISPERFFAGGGTTMRGFEQDMVGPTDTLENNIVRPVGGEALFLFNNEIRFPIFGILHGVGFVDIGNVYPRISDFDFTLRKSAGAGLRLKIKFIPLRFDYGIKLDRKPGESRGAFFFSIGQAF